MNDVAQALAERRGEVANERLEEARNLHQAGLYRGAVNRAYYAAFAAARALLVLKRLDSRTHQGVIKLFYQHYIKPGYFPKGDGRFLENAKVLREKADYDEYAPISPEKTRAEMDGAVSFVRAVERYLKDSRTLEERKEDSKR